MVLGRIFSDIGSGVKTIVRNNTRSCKDITTSNFGLLDRIDTLFHELLVALH